MAKKKNKFESQFSIYKVDYSNSVKYLKEEYDINVNNYSDLQNHILNNIKNVMNGKYNSDISNIDYIGFKGLVFKTHHYPSWNSIIKNMLDKDFDVSNTHISYILSYLTNNSIYLLTGGLGSNYISEYTEKNYGLYLLPKIIKEDSPVIKTVVENNLSGNKLSVKHSNRNVTTINTENEMSLIFRELTLALNSEMSKLLGIEIEDNNKKIINVSAKDSLVIRKSVTIDNLKKIIDGLSEIEKRKDSFSLGYFVDIKKNGYFSKDINNIMINDFINYKIDNFVLIGDDFLEYYMNGTRYMIKDSEDNILYESEQPFTFKEVFDYFFSKSISRSSVEKFLKYNITVDSDKERILYPIKVKDSIQGYVSDSNNVPFFLFNGSWLMFDKKYEDNLESEFKKNYKELKKININFGKLLENINNYESEDAYNVGFKDSSEIIVAHKVLCNNIELADLIYVDENNNLYLVHNKGRYNGSGARDVMNQVLTSSEFINKYIMQSNRQQILEEYYDKISNQYPDNIKLKELGKEKFIKLFFESTQVYYVVGFMEGLKEDIKSNYAKYMTLDTSSRLKEKGYELLLYDISKKN